jgi:hypothetical protein
MKVLRNIAICIISVGLILAVIPLIVYTSQFGIYNLSNDPGVWGVFGDYIGGTINPIIGLINLALLITISIYVAKLDSHRQFNEYRYQMYIQLCQKFEESQNTYDSLIKLKNYMKLYLFNNQYLFPSESNTIFNKSVESLIQTIETLIPIKEQYEDDVNSGKIVDIPIPLRLGREIEVAFKDWPKTDNEETRALSEFINAKKRVLGFIQAVMIEGNIKKYA